jgi:hypothetical protein
LRKKKVRIIFIHTITLLLPLLILSCQNENSQGGDKQNNNKKPVKFNLKQLVISDDSEDGNPKNKDTVYVKGRSVIFFTKSRKEFQKMLNTGGEESKWEFDMIYENFKKTADNSITALKEHQIYSVYTDRPVIQFYSEKKDTFIFNRTTNDYFIGQLFFNGVDSFRLEEGLIKTEDLESIVNEFFNLRSKISIVPVQEINDSFRYYKVDTAIVTVPDTNGK